MVDGFPGSSTHDRLLRRILVSQPWPWEAREVRCPHTRGRSGSRVQTGVRTPLLQAGHGLLSEAGSTAVLPVV
jgi:hypothetical protein